MGKLTPTAIFKEWSSNWLHVDEIMPFKFFFQFFVMQLWCRASQDQNKNRPNLSQICFSGENGVTKKFIGYWFSGPLQKWWQLRQKEFIREYSFKIIVSSSGDFSPKKETTFNGCHVLPWARFQIYIAKAQSCFNSIGPCYG
jgi:hypothetical protein